MLFLVNHCCSRQTLREGTQLANQMKTRPGDPSVSTLGVPTPLCSLIVPVLSSLPAESTACACSLCLCLSA